MKKIFILVLILSIMCIGCDKNGTEQEGVESIESAYFQISETEEGVNTDDKKDSDEACSKVEFWTDGNVIDLDITYDTLKGNWNETKGLAKIAKVDSYNDAVLWSIEIQTENEDLEIKPLYFYFSNDKIYNLDEMDGEFDDREINKAQLVYQEEDVYHEQDEDICTYGIEHKNEVTRFYMRNMLVETGYYRVIEFGKEKNILLYETGYGVGRELIRMKWSQD